MALVLERPPLQNGRGHNLVLFAKPVSLVELGSEDPEPSRLTEIVGRHALVSAIESGMTAEAGRVLLSVSPATAHGGG